MGTPHLETATVTFERRRESFGRAVGSLWDPGGDIGIHWARERSTVQGERQANSDSRCRLVAGYAAAAKSPKYLEQEFSLVKDMHLNAIRLEGKLETEHFFQLADEQGILVMLGWCCCDQWEHWKEWTPENYAVAAESLRSQMLRLRHHASLLVWLNGSDNPPPADVEQAYLAVEAETKWPNPILSSATQAPTTVTGKSGVKMSGPYDYVAPSYWLVPIRTAMAGPMGSTPRQVPDRRSQL